MEEIYSKRAISFQANFVDVTFKFWRSPAGKNLPPTLNLQCKPCVRSVSNTMVHACPCCKHGFTNLEMHLAKARLCSSRFWEIKWEPIKLTILE
jgi:hypothetical protein